MKEQLKRELHKTYLVLSSEETAYEEGYEIEMILKNEPSRLLPLHVLRVNGNVELYYDVSSRQTLEDLASREKLNYHTILELFEAIDQLLGQMKDYMLDTDKIVLDLKHIYRKEESFYFCYCPWEEQPVLQSFQEMLEEILGKIDYHDTDAVELAYHLYQRACKGDFHISEILKSHQKEEKEPMVLEPVWEEPFEVSSANLVQEEGTYHSESTGKEKKQKQGFVRKILGYFLKKEEPSEEMEEISTLPKETFESLPIQHSEFFQDTQVLNAADQETTLLSNMPVGVWRLRPLLPGFDEFCISDREFVVGKQRGSVDGVITRDSVSRIHCRFLLRDERLFLSDRGSTNGTYVNGKLVEPDMEVEIFPGDRIVFADVEYECYNSL